MQFQVLRLKGYSLVEVLEPRMLAFALKKRAEFDKMHLDSLARKKREGEDDNSEATQILRPRATKCATAAVNASFVLL